MNGFPSLAGSFSFDWDCRNTSGVLLDSAAQSKCSIASLLPENYIITTGDSPKVTQVKTDPYMIHLTYGQFTRIEYAIDKAAIVTIKLSSPSGMVNVLVNSLNQAAGSYVLEWAAADLTDVTGKQLVFSEKGNYMVTIQAVNPLTGSSSTARGNLKIGN
jgi:hypothetical protein